MGRRALIAVALLALVESAGAVDPFEIVPEGATGVARDAQPRLGMRNLDYRLDAPYPSSAVFELYERAIGLPWIACEGPQDNWEVFVDRASGEPRIAHQRLHYWVYRGEEKLLMLAAKYYSPGTTPRERPADDVQHVTLLQSQFPDIEQALASLGLHCAQSASAP